MKRILSVALFVLLACCRIPAATVTENLLSLGLGKLNTPISFTCTNNPQALPGGLGAGPTIVVTPINGSISTNLSPGGYVVRIPPYQFTISVPTDSGTYELISLATSGLTTYTYTNNQQYAVKATATDAFPGSLASKLTPGANVTFTTNGGTNITISSTGGSGGSGGQPAATSLSNVVSQASNIYVGSFTGNASPLTNLNAAANSLATSNQLANASNILNTAIGTASANAAAQTIASTQNLASVIQLNNASNILSAATVASTNSMAGLAAFKALGFFNQVANNGSDFSSMVKAGSNITGIVSIKSFGALGGNNDDTAAFQAALNYAAPVWVDSTTNYTVKNLYPTNGSCLLGAASIIMFNTSSTGNMFSNSVAVTNVIFDRLILSGQNFGFTGNGLSGGANSAPFDYVGGFIGTKQTVSVQRSGFMACSVSPSSAIRNCRAVGFSDAGFRLYGNGTFPQPEYQSIKFIDNEATACWIGLDLTNSAEYLPIANFCTEACGQGIAIQSGNDLISGGQDTRDGVGVAVLNGTNPAHNAVNNRTMNHCYLGVMANGVAVGEMFNNCEIYASGIAITNSGGITFQNCTLGGGGNFASISGFDIVVDGSGGGGLNYFVNNSVVAASLKISTNGGGLFLVNGWKNQQGGWLPSTNSLPTIYTATNTFIGPVVTSGHLDTNTTTGNSVLVTNGNVTASGTITGNGSGLTALNGANVTATTLPESALNLTDITTANASTTKHGLLPKEDNNVAHYLDGTGGWSTPPGGSGIASSGGVATNLTIYGSEVNTNTSGNFTKATNGNFTAGTSSGATITLNGSAGTVTAATFSGSGASLTSIPESGVTSLTTDLAAKAPLASPTFTGTATAGTFAGSGASLTGIPESGVTSLTSDLALKAPLASPTFTGTVTGGTFSGSGASLTSLPGGNITAATVVEAALGLTDITTANASTSAHGFLKKLDNNAAHYIDGTGAWSTPAGGGGSQSPITADVNYAQHQATNVISFTITNTPFSLVISNGILLLSSNGVPVTILNLQTNGIATGKGVFTNFISAPYFSGAGPTNTVVSGTAAGSTGAAYNTNITDSASSGIVKLQVSGTGTGVGPLFTITYGTPFLRLPKVTISAADANSASVTYNSGSIYVDFLTETTNGFSVFCTGTVNPATMYWVWHAEQ